MWARGLGLGIPAPGWFTQIIALNRLTRNEITSREKDGDFMVQHKLVGAGTIIITALLFIGFIFLTAIGETGD